MANKIRNGFSLVELLVVVAIIGVLAGIGSLAYLSHGGVTKLSHCGAKRDPLLLQARTRTQTQWG